MTVREVEILLDRMNGADSAACEESRQILLAAGPEAITALYAIMGANEARQARRTSPVAAFAGGLIVCGAAMVGAASGEFPFSAVLCAFIGLFLIQANAYRSRTAASGN